MKAKGATPDGWARSAAKTNTANSASAAASKTKTATTRPKSARSSHTATAASHKKARRNLPRLCGSGRTGESGWSEGRLKTVFFRFSDDLFVSLTDTESVFCFGSGRGGFGIWCTIFV